MKDEKHIAIIGSGAAGLATARAFLASNNPETKFQVDVFESRHRSGGIWDYSNIDVNGKKTRPMYKDLKTNLPKELMAYREFPWTETEDSYVTHSEVKKYLDEYLQKFNLEKHIHYGCKVIQLTVLEKDQEWSQVNLQWNFDGEIHQQTFDIVCVCNGHYALPSHPKLKGIENFKGQIIHAVEYDCANDYIDKTVLCVGARASGTDIAREIGLYAKKVYLSDSTCDEKKEFDTNVVLMPRTQCVDDNGGIHFYSSDPKRAEILRGIDAIIYCSGYDYHFDFINQDSNLDLKVVPGERRVAPLYKQLWHARHPSIAFIGLPNYVVPFPLFEIQANAVRIATQQYCVGQNTILPIMSDRLQDAERDAVSGGPNGSGRVQDTHSLGSQQWDYCRDIAKISGVYDSSMENYLAVNKQLHSFSMREKKATIPGGEDTYRLTRFHRDDKNQTYRIISSGMPTLPSVT
eukprot:scaffold46697_cov72-Cyclotella_meneghiniana.AAC.2